MDYKYLEQLLERYWAAETTLDEERILRAFFSDASQVPLHLQRYRKLFNGWQAAKTPTLGADFDEKMLAMVEPETVTARRITWRGRLAPLWKSAAVIALIVGAGTSMQRSMEAGQDAGRAMAHEQQADTTIAVQVAYEPVQSIDSVKIVDETLLK
jgi:S-adenosylmethionine:tRNA-ribosyltransferase-isomerase (queuine synthetase)